MDWVAILDFGSQYTHLIARRIRECKVYSEILPYNISPEELLYRKPSVIILSGGPASVTGHRSPTCREEVLHLGIPVVGICYGAQLIARFMGGEVKPARKREYGKAVIRIKSNKEVFRGLKKEEIVWMSHGDIISKLPRGFKSIGRTENSPYAAFCDREERIFGFQFHPEVTHTPRGKTIIRNILFRIARCKPSWNMRSFVKNSIEEIREKVKGDKVICALSGGVDSSVMVTLLHRAIGKQLIPLFIDNGLLRKNERKIVQERFHKLGIRIRTVDAVDEFLSSLKGIADPEKKRKIIGERFIRVFEREARKIGNIRFLAQGTLYPDVIESKNPRGGPSATIKTHHNVGGLPDDIKFDLIEPLKDLFKDEVRLVGKELGLPDDVVYRQPFPGPGLAVRVIGEITRQKLDILREADWILIDEIKNAGLYRKLWQSFCVLLPVRSVGVMGDSRTYEYVVAVRAVTSLDAMTANWAHLPYPLLEKVSSRIINEVKGVNRVVYDISSKPPSTIEWE